MNEQTAQEIIETSKAGYNKIADEFSKTRKVFWQELDLIKDYIKGGDELLDVGCGNGRFFDFIKDKNVNYTGIDNSKELLKIAEKRYGTLGKFILSDATEIPFRNEMFDIVVSFAVLHHIPSSEYRNKFFKEINRTLEKDGIFILSAWNMWQKKFLRLIIKNAFLKIIGKSKLDFKDIFLGFGKEKNIRYLHAFTKKELEKLALKNGFSIQKSMIVKTGKKRSNFLLICKKI